MSESRPDPTRMRNQASLTTSHGSTWVMIALVTAVVLTFMFLLLASAGDPIVPWVGIITTAALLTAMLVARILVPFGRARLMVLAGLYATMLVVALALTLQISVARAP